MAGLFKRPELNEYIVGCRVSIAPAPCTALVKKKKKIQKFTVIMIYIS
jgi:hypothetical protein